MNKKDLKDLRITEGAVVAPGPFKGLANLTDDYDVNAKLLLITDRMRIDMLKQSINCESDYKYGPKTSYKNKYSYNRDD